jgi:hypothetical protein
MEMSKETGKGIEHIPTGRFIGLGRLVNIPSPSLTVWAFCLPGEMVFGV